MPDLMTFKFPGNIEFVRDPFMISPGREFSAAVKKVILLDEAAFNV